MGHSLRADILAMPGDKNRYEPCIFSGRKGDIVNVHPRRRSKPMPRTTGSIPRVIRSEEAHLRLQVDHLDALATLGDGEVQARLLREVIRDYVALEARVDSLLKNTLPASVAEEIKYRGSFAPRDFDCSILFADLVHFTQLAELLPPAALVQVLDRLFCGFDALMELQSGTKIKTIGDAYMAVFGAPRQREDHAAAAVACGLEMVNQVAKLGRETGHPLALRVGIHSGKATAGVVGRLRMQFDVFGDDVNIASRLEAAGEPGKVNISEETRRQVGGAFTYQERGMITLKNKDPIAAYFVMAPREPGKES